MTFKYKLSRRLALLKDRWVLLSVTTHAVALAVGACARPVTGPQAPNSPVVRIVTLPDSVTLNPSDMRQFVAYGRTQAGDSVPVAVSWSVSGGTITGGGLYTAHTVAGTYTVTATATSPSTAVSGSALVKNPGPVSQIVLNPTTAFAVVGGTVQFTSYGKRKNGDSVAVSVVYAATGGGVSATGVYTAGQSPGSYRVIASQSRGTLADTALVSISAVPVASVTVSPAAASQPAEPDLDVPLERDVLVEVGLVPHLARIHVAVQHQPAQPLREHRRVDLGQVGAVRETEVVDLTLAERGPDAVHVLGGVDRRHVVQQRAAVLTARGGVGLGPGEPDVLQRAGARHVVRAVRAEVVRVAGQRRLAGSDAARVEADPVVGVAGVLRDELAEGGQAHTRAAGPAGVDEHDPLVRGVRHLVLDPRHGNLDLGTVRMAVVQRHRKEAAIRTGVLQSRIGADIPFDVRDIGLRRCRRLGPRRRSRSDQRHGQYAGDHE